MKQSFMKGGPLLLLLAATAFAGNSQLWGSHGELWDPLGRLPDFSYAGYHAGEDPLPDVPVVQNVRDHGAVGDGVTDDTAAIRAAIAATSEGAVLFPAGTYRLTDVLELHDSGVVLRGEGPEHTTLFVDASLADVRGAAPQWSWNGGFVWYQPIDAPAELTALTAGALRGARELEVADAAGIDGGDWITLRLVDDDERSLGRHLHNEQQEAGDCAYQVPMRIDWPVQVTAVEGSTLTLAQPLRIDVRPEWTPTVWTAPAVTEVGVEHLRMRFPDLPYAGHLNEPGYNGIFMDEGVRDAWVRDVVFENADNGLLTDWLSKHITATDIGFEGRDGHHGFNIAFTADSLFQDVRYDSDWVHHFTLDHRSNGNVLRRVSSEHTVAIDHHRDTSFENLLTDIQTTTSFFHGGSACAGMPSGARGTAWNLQGPLIPPYWGQTQFNAVGQLTVDDTLTADMAWFENVDDLRPADLYEAQLGLRLGTLQPPDDDTGTDTDTMGASDEPGCGCSGAGGLGTGWLLGLLALWRRSRSTAPYLRRPPAGR